MFGGFFFQPYMGLGNLPKPFLGGLCLANQVVMKYAIIELKIKLHAIIDNKTMTKTELWY
jgi:hypothetical protein